MGSSAGQHGQTGRWLLSALAMLGAALAPCARAADGLTGPEARTGAATAVTYQSADLTGAVAPRGQPTTYFFQYGPTTQYGSQSSPASPALGARTLGVRSTVVGLLPLTQYHYRLVAINALGTAFGGDATFTTPPVPLSLAISALPNPVALGAPLSVVGTLTGTGSANSVVVLQQNPFPFQTGFRVIGSPGMTSSTGGFQFELPSLSVTTQLRVVSVGPGEPVLSGTLTAFVHLAVTISVTRTHSAGHAAGTSGAHGTRGVRRLLFSGRITPAQTGARVSVQRLAGGRWALVAATLARAAVAGSSSYSLPLSLRHSGLYRAFAAAVEGGHVPSVSQPVIVHVSG